MSEDPVRRERLFSLIVAAALVLAEPSRAAGQGSVPTGNLEPGAYAVGFRTLYARDPDRSWFAPGRDTTTTDPGRPIRISIWYPSALDDRTPRMRYGDYFHFAGPADFEALNEALEHADRQSWIADLTEVSSAGSDLSNRLFATPVAARRDAAPAPGRFPVVLYTGGLGSRSDANAELGEYLASHGYVVATVPQLGRSATSLDLGGAPAEVLVHVQDLECALATIRTLPYVDPGPVAIAGQSVGGVVALEFAMRNLGVAAVIGLDGSYGMRREGIQPTSPDQGFCECAPERMTASLLDLRRGNGVQGVVLDGSVVAALRRADRYVVTFQRMFHGDFTEFAPIALLMNVPLPPNTDGRTRQTGYDGNQAAYRAILEFLEAELRHREGRLQCMLDDLKHVSGVTVVHEKSAPAIK